MQLSRVRLYAYLAPFLLCPLLILIGAIEVAPTEWFARRAHVPYLMAMGYGAQLRNTRCDVAIYGDSTAMIGIYPEIVARRTGLTVCNIADNEGMTMINQTLIVDQFLQHNPRPRFLIFLYSPENFEPQSQRHDAQVTTFEAITYRFRQPGKLLSFLALMKHPTDVLDWADHCFRLAVEGLAVRPLPLETKQIRFNTSGRWPFDMPRLTSCNYPSRATLPDMEFVRGLRRKYQQGGTTVLLDSISLPECDPDLTYFRNSLKGVIDNTIETLPVSDYYVGGRHVNASGGLPLSTMVADQIEAQMTRSATLGAAQ